jgi:hypothetical protein
LSIVDPFRFIQRLARQSVLSLGSVQLIVRFFEPSGSGTQSLLRQDASIGESFTHCQPLK